MANINSSIATGRENCIGIVLEPSCSHRIEVYSQDQILKAVRSLASDALASRVLERLRSS